MMEGSYTFNVSANNPFNGFQVTAVEISGKCNQVHRIGNSQVSHVHKHVHRNMGIHAHARSYRTGNNSLLESSTHFDSSSICRTWTALSNPYLRSISRVRLSVTPPKRVTPKV